MKNSFSLKACRINVIADNGHDTKEEDPEWEKLNESPLPFRHYIICAWTGLDIQMPLSPKREFLEEMLNVRLQVLHNEITIHVHAKPSQIEPPRGLTLYCMNVLLYSAWLVIQPR